MRVCINYEFLTDKYRFGFLSSLTWVLKDILHENCTHEGNCFSLLNSDRIYHHKVSLYYLYIAEIITSWSQFNCLRNTDNWKMTSSYRCFNCASIFSPLFCSPMTSSLSNQSQYVKPTYIRPWCTLSWILKYIKMNTQLKLKLALISLFTHIFTQSVSSQFKWTSECKFY